MLIDPALSQEKQYKYFYLETGIDFIHCSASDKDYIRGEVNPDPYFYEPSYLVALLYRNYASAKFEIRAARNLLGILGGIRYTHMESSIGKNDYWTSQSDYFYLLFQQDGTNTEYLKVKDITQSSNYIGVPLEIRIYPYKKQRNFQMYYKFGIDFNMLLNSRTKVKFQNWMMKQYEDDVEDVIEDPWPFYASLHLAAGLRIGKENKPGVNIEACAPSAMLYKSKHSSFVFPNAGGGIQLNIRFPF